MKIALCLSGQARSYKEGYKYYLENLLTKYKVDVYIHTWSFPEVADYVELYQAVAWDYQTPPLTDADKKYTNTPNAERHPPRFTERMLYSMHSCSQLIQGDYDWVIKSRSDYALNTIIPFEELDNTKLYIPNCRMVPERDFGNDQFAFGSQDTMMKYMSTWQNMEDYYNAGAQFIGEDMMSANLHHHGLTGDKLVYVNMNNPFPPGPQNGTWHSLIRDDYEQWAKS
jgi:hypothetical protein